MSYAAETATLHATRQSAFSCAQLEADKTRMSHAVIEREDGAFIVYIADASDLDSGAIIVTPEEAK